MRILRRVFMTASCLGVYRIEKKARRVKRGMVLGAVWLSPSPVYIK